MFTARKVDNFLDGAKLFKGQWYQWGGGHGGEMKKPGRVDCSGLVMQAGYKADINLVGRAQDQQDKGRSIGMKNLKPGDLVFNGNPAYHVGIYIGRGKVLHAPRTGTRVGITDVGNFDSARRIFSGYTDATLKGLATLRSKFRTADDNHDGRLAGQEFTDSEATGLRRFDRDGNEVVNFDTIKSTFLRGKKY